MTYFFKSVSEHPMKKLYFYLVFAAMVGRLQAQVLQQHFNSGNRNAEAANCWYTPGCSFVNSPGEVLEGSHTLRTGQLSGGTAFPNGLVSPWIKLEGNGTIRFKHRLNTWNSGISRTLNVSLEDAAHPDVQDTI
jgi:hypothetical protein